MTRLRLTLLTALTLLAFAGNSVLCRIALRHTAIDAASFTSVRLVSGALVLVWIAHRWRADRAGGGSWGSALALLAYAAGFSWAYTQLSAGTGALLLFGAVQATMIGRGLWAGERLLGRQWAGLAMAMGGLLGLMLPGASAPPLLGATLMVGAGVAWGVYSLRGRGAGDPTRVTTGNFWRAALLALAMSAVLLQQARWDAAGLACAVASGAITSGLGYALWYAVLPQLRATTAATVQLSVPVLAALGGMVLLGETMSLRWALAALAVLGGIAAVVWGKARG
ncbi:MAG: hypothetical protein RJA98_3834 [Pseudomonadota bacterium]